MNDGTVLSLTTETPSHAYHLYYRSTAPSCGVSPFTDDFGHQPSSMARSRQERQNKPCMLSKIVSFNEFLLTSYKLKPNSPVDPNLDQARFSLSKCTCHGCQASRITRAIIRHQSVSSACRQLPPAAAVDARGGVRWHMQIRQHRNALSSLTRPAFRSQLRLPIEVLLSFIRPVMPLHDELSTHRLPNFDHSEKLQRQC